MDATPRALLVTDVVDSTKLAQQLGDVAAAALWAAHDRVARDLLAAHGGREIDKTDGFLLLFDGAPAAAAYALAYHRAIGALQPPLRARAGLHLGAVILTENRPEDVARGAKPLEVDGLAKPIAARVMSVAGGGQTLLTASAREALGVTHRAVSHGHWQMKGVTEPVELFEVGDADSPMTPPADGAKVYRVVEQAGVWLPVREVKHSLPRERDAFVGRQSDLLDLARLLDDGASLVSVLGVGGTGKTRLVTHFGWTWLGDWPGGVWFCDLSEARGVDGIVYAVGRSLEAAGGAGDAVAQVGEAIAARGRCLVLLDNFEQVARHAPDTLGRWLDRAVEAQFVVTTREVLGLPGEVALALAPLRPSDSEGLFVARARGATREFDPAPHRETIRRLVALLDHLPLAIELAAARVRAMPPDKILARMSERFRLLTSSGGRQDRQSTLRAALDWSWDLLSTEERSALAQLAVFEGGIPFDGAVAVLDLPELWPEDAVQALVDKSLLQRVAEDRFDLLVSVQEYAAEKSEALGVRAEAEVRHGRWCAQVASGLVGWLRQKGEREKRAALAKELDNHVVACRRAIARGDGEVAVLTMRAATAVFELQGPYESASELALAVLEIPGLAPTHQASAAERAGSALQPQGRIEEARACYERALGIARAIGRPRGEASSLGNIGRLLVQQGKLDEALGYHEQVLVAARAMGDRGLEATGLGNLGALLAMRGEADRSAEVMERALALHREIGNRRAEGIVLVNLAQLLEAKGEIAKAVELDLASLSIHRELGDRRYEAMVLGNLGHHYLQQGRMAEARACLEEAVALGRAIGDRQNEAFARAILGALHSGEGRLAEARACLEPALALARSNANRRNECVALRHLAVLRLREGHPADAVAHFEQALQVAREVGDPQDQRAALQGLLDLLAELGRVDEFLAAADALEALVRAAGGGPELAELGCRRAEVLAATDPAAARAALDEARGHAERANVSPDAGLWLRLRDVGARFGP